MKRSRTLVLVMSALVGPLSAEGGETFDRLGRLWGYGWSDGYHACSADGFQFGENLPPHSFAASASRSVISQHPGSSPVLGYQSAQGCDESLIDGGAHWLTGSSAPAEVAVPPASALPALAPAPQKAAEPLPAPQGQPAPNPQGNRGRSGFPRKLAVASPGLESAQASLPAPGPTEVPNKSASPSRMPLVERGGR